MITKDLGAVSAYAYAKEKGYTGTEAEFAELMASYAAVAEQAGESAQTATEKAQQASASATSASQSADTASASATSAQASAQTASTKASEASTSATTATTKAQEASQSASESSQSASTAVQANRDAESAKTASETAQAGAESARDDAESARDEAQQYAESIDPEKLIGAYPVDTATGAIASFTDGADNIPMKSIKVRIEPVQSGSGDPSPDNVRPISGWESVVVSHSGVNIFDKATAVQNRYISNDDGLERQSTGCVSTDYVPVKPNTSYYIVTEQQKGRWGAWYDGEKNYISGIAGYDVLTAPSNAQFMRLTVVWVVSDVKYGNLDTFGINYPSTDTDYHPYSGNSLSIPLSQTVYGGTLDVTTGELVVDRAMVDLGTLTWTYNASYKFFKADLDGKANGRTNLIASSYAYGDVWDTSTDYIVAGHTGTNAIYVKDSRYTDASTFKSAMDGVQLVYELAEPITLTLTPTEIKSLLGDNNLWADAGDATVTYRADTTMYINRKIAEAVSALS